MPLKTALSRTWERPMKARETMIGVERAETTETSVDDPKLVVATPSQFMDVDVTGDMNAARKIAGVVFARRLQLLRHRRHVAIVPDGVAAAYREAGIIGGNAHGFGERSEMGVQHIAIGADENDFPGLVGGDY